MSSTHSQSKAPQRRRFYGTGRRKNAIARVFLSSAAANLKSIGRPVDEYFRNVDWLQSRHGAAEVHQHRQSVDVWATVNGGGVGGQSGAVRMGLSRALGDFQSRVAHGLAKERFSDARFAHARTQEVRAEGRPQALPVQQALTRQALGPASPGRIHGRQGAGNRMFRSPRGNRGGRAASI